MNTILRWCALLVLGLFWMAPLGAAQAIPDDGAGANTPGTAAQVSPRSLRPGDTLAFTLSGFPAGETVYIKIDDGRSCSAASVHGACVQHLQRISANGTVSGSFQLPSDLAPGTHWLRFLASAEVRDSSGGYQGIKGYTRRSPDFTVTAAGSGSKQDSGSSPDATVPNPTDSSTTTDPGAVPGSDGAPQLADADQALVAPKMAAATPSPSAAPTEAAASEQPAVDAAQPAQVAQPAAEAEHTPYVGAGALALCLLASAWLLVRRRRVPVGG